MDEFVDERERLGRGCVLVIDDDEWCNLISNRKSSKHTLIQIRMVGSKIPNQHHEYTKRFDSLSERSELLGCRGNSRTTDFVDAQSDPNRSSRIRYRFSYGQ